MDRLLASVLVCVACLGLAGTARAAPFVGIAPRITTIRARSQLRFTATVYFSTNKVVTWTVNGVPGGNTLLGTVTADGVYTAPPIPPLSVVTLAATSVATPHSSAKASITVLHPEASISSIDPTTVAPGAFTITIDGRGFVPASSVRYGSTTLATTWISTTRVVASGTASSVVGDTVSISITNPDPGGGSSAAWPLTIARSSQTISTLAAARFLEQTSWGPNPQSIARVQEIGFEAYLDEQFEQPASTYPTYGSGVLTLVPVQQRFLVNALSGSDQLRQRVAFALSQMFVVSGYKTYAAHMYAPWLQMLLGRAFDSYAALLEDVTLSPTMAHFLDIANNEKANPTQGTVPNENYARELLQLFTIGIDQLNDDATPQLDASGQRIPTFDQTVVEGMARAFTGWTYPRKPGAVSLKRNPMYFVGRLEPVPASHDVGEKTVLDDVVLAAGQSPEQDLDAVLGVLVRHPNTGPFLARHLIQQLVTSNPSPDYVRRVASVFTATSDMRHVIKAIVLDPEARRGDTPDAAAPTDGHLREPVLFALALLRAMGATVSESSPLVNIISPAGQSLFYPPSVFNYYPATHELPSGLRAPEFHIFTPSTSVYRANLAFYATFGKDGYGITIDAAPFEALAGNPPQLVEAVNRALLFGRMSPEMRQSIETAVGAVTSYSPWTRAATALFLVASSSQYQVQR